MESRSRHRKKEYDTRRGLTDSASVEAPPMGIADESNKVSPSLMPPIPAGVSFTPGVGDVQEPAVFVFVLLGGQQVADPTLWGGDARFDRS